MAEISDLLGKTITKIEFEDDFSAMHFHCSNDHFYSMCDEEGKNFISLESIIGNLNNLINSPIIETKKDVIDNYTFFSISTEKGNVAVKWAIKTNEYEHKEVDFTDLYVDAEKLTIHIN